MTVRLVSSLCLSLLKMRLSFPSMLSAITVSAGCCQGKEEKLRVGRGYTLQWHSSQRAAGSNGISASSSKIVRSFHLPDGSLWVIARMGLSKLHQANGQMWGGTVAARFIISFHFQKLSTFIKACHTRLSMPKPASTLHYTLYTCLSNERQCFHF